MWFSIVLPDHNKRGLSLERTSSGWQRVLLHNFYIIAGRLLTVTNTHEREAIDGPQLKRKACIKSLSLLLGDHAMPEQPERALAITSIHPFTHFLTQLTHFRVVETAFIRRQVQYTPDSFPVYVRAPGNKNV